MRMSEYWTLGHFIRDYKGEKELCFARHTRGPGEGLYNGYGGKGTFPQSPSLVQLSEAEAESRAKPSRKEMVLRAEFDFYLNGKHRQLFYFFMPAFIGNPRSTQEMESPIWVPSKDLTFDSPFFDKTFPPDRHWLPRVFNEELRGTIRLRTVNGRQTLEDIDLRAA